LTQLTAQSAFRREALPVAALLNQFLYASKVAVEESAKVAFEYDSSLWKDVGERCQRKDKTCVPSAIFFRIDEDRRARARTSTSTSAKDGKTTHTKDFHKYSNHSSVNWSAHRQSNSYSYPSSSWHKSRRY